MMTVALPRRAPRRLHRLPALLGAISRREVVRRGDRGGRRPPRDHGRHLRGDGHGQHHGLHRRGARHDAARHGGHPRRARRPAARGRGDRRARGRADRHRSRPRQIITAAVDRERAARAARDRRLDQRDHPPDGDRRPARLQVSLKRLNALSDDDAGAGRPEADRPATTWRTSSPPAASARCCAS